MQGRSGRGQGMRNEAEETVCKVEVVREAEEARVATLEAEAEGVESKAEAIEGEANIMREQRRHGSEKVYDRTGKEEGAPGGGNTVEAMLAKKFRLIQKESRKKCEWAREREKQVDFTGSRRT